MTFWSFGDLYQNPPATPLALTQVKLSPQTLSTQLKHSIPTQKSPATRIELVMLANSPYYRVHYPDHSVYLVDQSGQVHHPISPELAASIAREQYLGQGTLATIDFLPESSGNYFSSQPVYKALFQDPQATEVYINPQSGELLARRKALWRWYNRMWEFHLMKYTSHAPLNKYLLLLSAVLSFGVSLTGLFKFFYRS